jgi:hypothetical protein
VDEILSDEAMFALESFREAGGNEAEFDVSGPHTVGMDSFGDREDDDSTLPIEDQEMFPFAFPGLEDGEAQFPFEFGTLEE